MNYDRIVLIKISGEKIPLDNDKTKIEYLKKIIKELIALESNGIKSVIVIGGGNICRGRQNEYLTRVVSDRVGMLGTIINGLIFNEIANKCGLKTTVLSHEVLPQFCHTYNIDLAKDLIKRSYSIVSAGGIGAPFVSTDTTALIRAVELDCELVIKLTQTDGVYDDDPKLNPKAKRYSHVSYKETIEKKLNFMDINALEIAKNNNIKLAVGKFSNTGDLVQLIDDSVNSMNRNFTLIN